MKTRLVFYSVFAVFLLSLHSCVDSKKFDFSKLSTKIDGTGSVAAKLAYSTIKVSDLLKTSASSYLMYDKTQDSLLRIVYSNDSLYSVGVDKIYQAPAPTPVSGRFTVGQVDLSSINKTVSITLQDVVGKMQDANAVAALNLASTNGANGNKTLIPALNPNPAGAGSYPAPVNPNFNSVTFSGGTLDLTVTNKFAFPITLDLAVANVGGSVIESYSNITLASNATTVISRPLAGKTYSNALEGRIISFKTAGSGVPVLVKNTDQLTYSLAFNNPVIGNPSKTITQNLDFTDAGSTYKLKAVKLTKGGLDLVFNASLTSQVSLAIKLPYTTTVAGNPVTASVVVAKVGTTKCHIDLSNTLSDLTLADPNVSNKIQVSCTATYLGSSISFSSADYLDYTVSASGLDFDYVQGYFGQKTLAVDPQSVNLGIDAFNNIDGDFKLTNPKLTLSVTNYSMGVSSKLSSVVVGQNKDNTKTVALNYTGSPTLITAPTAMYTSSKTDLAIDNTNSAIVDLMALPANKINFSGNLSVNPSGVVANNFVTRKAYVKVGAKLDVPFEFSSTGINFKDTLKNTIGDNLKTVQQAKLILEYSNGLPIEATVNLVLLDAADKPIDLIPLKDPNGNSVTLNSAVYDATTKNTTAVSGSFTFDLTPTHTTNLSKASKIVIVGVANTKGKSVSFKGKYSLSIKLKATATFDYSKI